MKTKINIFYIVSVCPTKKNLRSVSSSSFSPPPHPFVERTDLLITFLFVVYAKLFIYHKWIGIYLSVNKFKKLINFVWSKLEKFGGGGYNMILKLFWCFLAKFKTSNILHIQYVTKWWLWNSCNKSSWALCCNNLVVHNNNTTNCITTFSMSV